MTFIRVTLGTRCTWGCCRYHIHDRRPEKPPSMASRLIIYIFITSPISESYDASFCIENAASINETGFIRWHQCHMLCFFASLHQNQTAVAFAFHLSQNSNRLLAVSKSFAFLSTVSRVSLNYFYYNFICLKFR